MVKEDNEKIIQHTQNWSAQRRKTKQKGINIKQKHSTPHTHKRRKLSRNKQNDLHIERAYQVFKKLTWNGQSWDLQKEERYFYHGGNGEPHLNQVMQLSISMMLHTGICVLHKVYNTI